MITVTISDNLRSVLAGIKEEALLRGENGDVIGRFSPGRLSDEEAYALAPGLFDREEIKRRKAAESGKGRTTAEVLERLQSLERQP